MVSPVRYLQDPQLVQALLSRGSELLRFGDEQQKAMGASLLQWVEEQGGHEGALASSELCKGGAESKRGCSGVERVVGGTTQVMQHLDVGHVAFLAGVGLLGQVTRNGVMGWMGRRVESWWNRGTVGTVIAKGAGVTTEVVGITGIGIAHKVKAGQPVDVSEEFFHTGIGWLGLRLGMEGLGVVPKALHQWGRYEVPRLAGAMTFTRTTSAFVGGTVGMVAVGQDVYQAATTQAQFMVGMRGVHEFIPAYSRAAANLHTRGRFLAAKLDLTKYPKLLKSFQWPNFPSAGMKPLLAGANLGGSRASLSVKLPEADKGGFRAYSTWVNPPGAARETPVSDQQIHQTLDYVRTLPPFNIDTKKLPHRPAYPKQGRFRDLDRFALYHSANALTFVMREAAPEEAFREMVAHFQKLPERTEAAIIFYKPLTVAPFGFRPVGYRTFEVDRAERGYAITYKDVYVHESERGGGLRDIMDSTLLGTVMFTATAHGKSVQVTYHHVENPLNRARYIAAGMEEVEPPWLEDSEPTFTYGVPVMGYDEIFQAANTPPSFRTTHNSGALKLQLDRYARTDKVLGYVKTLPPFNIDRRALPDLSSWAGPPKEYDLPRFVAGLANSVVAFKMNPTFLWRTFQEIEAVISKREDIPHGMVLVYEGETPIGFLEFSLFSMGGSDYTVILTNTYVEPSSRGHGVYDSMAQTIVGATLHAAMKKGGSVEVVQAQVENIKLVAQFRMAGMEESPAFGPHIMSRTFRVTHDSRQLKSYLDSP